MSPRCRRSARIASASKRSGDSPAPQQLTSVVEADETIETKEANETPKTKKSTKSTKSAKRSRRSSSRVNNAMSSPMPVPATPSSTAPPKLAMTEMHPSKAHQTMAPPSSGLRNGFVDIDYNRTPMESLAHNTPSKTPAPAPAPSSEFTFRYTRSGGADHKLGPDARKLMDSLRKEVAEHKAQFVAEQARELAEKGESQESRKIAAAKGKSGRFSAVHLAEFKKMDSIEGHASLFRAAPGRFTPGKATTPTKLITPLKPGTKRSQSKANLDEPDSARSKTAPPRQWARSGDKREGAEHSSKRIRQRIEDDASTLRPVSRDGTVIQRPKSSGNDSARSGIPRPQALNSLMTPTKSSLARTLSAKPSTTGLVGSPIRPSHQKVNSFSAKVGTSLLRSPSKTHAGLPVESPSKKGFAGLKMWAMKNNLDAGSGNIPTQIVTPGRFDRIKSILKRHPGGTPSKSAIPQPSTSIMKTPSQPDLTESMFPPVPLTTPTHKHGRHVEFTLETKRAAMAQESPSPVKPSIPRSAVPSKIAPPKFVAGGKAVMNKESTTGEVTYPDLSAYQVDEDKPQSPVESVPSTFTFRSDHTIRFDNSPPKGFGAAAGQSSIRQVRKSTSSSTQMPGSFPGPTELLPNKENTDPLTRNGIPHGMTNKKRHRAGSEEDGEEDEGSRRGVKKPRKNGPTAEGHALVAPRLAGRLSPTKPAGDSISRTPSPQKKKAGLSLSRLHLLAQPKIRK